MKAKVYVLGGREKGESVFIIIYNSNTVGQKEAPFALLVDSFEGVHDFLVQKKSELNFDFLNCICWTHPHDDHTGDLLKIIDKSELFRQYIKNDSRSGTSFIIPEYLTSGNIHLYDKDVLKLLSKKSIKVNVKNNSTQNRTWTISEGNFVRIHFLTPTAKSFLQDEWVGHDQLNKLSLSMVVSISDEYFIYLGGDCQDDDIRRISKRGEDLIMKSSVIKLPHHGSDTSLCLKELLGSNVEYIVTTSKGDVLPKKDVINQYEEKTGLCVHNTKQSFDNNNAQLGVVEIDVDFDSKGGHVTHVSKYSF